MMKKLKLCNVHKLAIANEGEGRKPIHIPFWTWAYDDTIDQTLDREHAEKIANSLKEMIDKGEPGIPVYQGHPDVPECFNSRPSRDGRQIRRGLGKPDGKLQEGVIFCKKYDDGTVCCVEIDWFRRKDNRRELKFQTMWKEKPEEVTEK